MNFPKVYLLIKTCKKILSLWKIRIGSWVSLPSQNNSILPKELPAAPQGQAFSSSCGWETKAKDFKRCFGAFRLTHFTIGKIQSLLLGT